jgi:drug/metabolite transporter (DMT)-like permease
METIYRWFDGWYNSNLTEHLSGWDEMTGDYTKTNLFSLVGIVALIVAVVLCVAYYYIINHPRFNRVRSWWTILVAVAVLNFGFAFQQTLSDVENDNISSDLQPITWFDCFMFAFTNLIIASLFFLFCSLIIKWGSRNAKYSSFIKF